MPYRHAYLWVLLLFPAVAFAFWPSYFSRLDSVSWIIHAHGVTASLWIVLTTLQAWSIHREARPLHRLSGRASLFLFPLFWISGLLIVQVMAAGFVARDNPFHAMYGARLTAVDALTSLAILYLYYVALSRRRSVLTHAASMLAIPLFLLPPIFVRLLQIGGPLAIRGPDQFYKFAYGAELCFLVSALIALWIWSRRTRTAWPFLVTAFSIAALSLAFETLGRTASWESVMPALASLPTSTVAAAGLLVSGTVVWLGWTRGSAKTAINSAPAQIAPAE